MTETANRRAALALHGLSAKDREWVLSQLPSSDKETLSGHLDELEELGFPSDVSDLVDAVTAGDPPVRIAPEVELIDAAAPKVVHRILKDEQASTLALIVSCHPWQWQKRVMRGLGRVRSRAVREAIAQQKFSVSEAVRHGVLSSLATAIADASSRNAPVYGFDWRGMFR